MSGMMDEATEQDMKRIYEQTSTKRSKSKKPNRSNKPKESYTSHMNVVQKARMAMREALKDEGLRICYIANIAMLLYDRYGIRKKYRNQAAEDILKLIFE